MPVRTKELYGIALCNYAGDVSGSLTLSVGDVVVINDECEGTSKPPSDADDQSLKKRSKLRHKVYFWNL
jgi:hypothetical protein